MAYIVAAVRSAGGKRAGKLSGWHPTELGAEIINNLINKTRIDPSLVDDVILGCVDQAGLFLFLFLFLFIFFSSYSYILDCR